MRERIVNKIRHTKTSPPFPGFGVGTVIVAVFCAFLIVTATFTPVPLKIFTVPEKALSHTAEFFSGMNSPDSITRVLNYIPQIPIVIMISAMLGPLTGMISVLLYVLAGLVGIPVFASGWGINIRFGYIIGFFAGIYVTGRLLSKKPNMLKAVKAAIAGVIAIHIIGIIYLSGALLLKQESVYSIFGWIIQLSGMQVVYDMIFGIAAAFLGRLLRHTLWVATD